MEGDSFAGVPVRDRAVAVRWHEALLGAAPAFLPNDREAVWFLRDRLLVHVDVRPEAAGHALHTVFVADLGSCLADIAERGIRPDAVERYENGVTKAVFHDPDGDELGSEGRAAAPEQCRPPTLAGRVAAAAAAGCRGTPAARRPGALPSRAGRLARGRPPTTSGAAVRYVFRLEGRSARSRSRR